MSTSEPLLPALSIAAVERDTGLSKDTLRVWERRYGFPSPGRDGDGNRVYPLEQVERLRVIRRLVDVGHRPGRVARLPAHELQALSAANLTAPSARRPDAATGPDLDPHLRLIVRHDAQGLQRGLVQCALRLGLADFVIRVLGPLTTAVGDAWASGRLQVHDEHLYTEVVARVLRGALADISAPPAGAAPRVLLTTVPGEPHGLGLLMAETLFALEGCQCRALGPQTPIGDIVQAARRWQMDIVALSFTATLSNHAVVAALRELRGLLTARVAIWVGGECPAWRRREMLDGQIACVRELESLPERVTRWRVG